MTTTLSTLRQILRKELLVPAGKIRSRQILTSDVGLSELELNALLYFIEEKYKLELKVLQPSSTVKELVDQIDKKFNSEPAQSL